MISIIVPVYNSKDRITKCIASILNQTYKNIEILMVDDGSTDGSGLICDGLVEENPGICRVIHQKNMGVSAARNVAIANARGEYIGFVDSDDYIEPNFLEKLFAAMEQNDADIVVSYFNVIKGDEIFPPKMEPKDTLYYDTNHDDVFLNFFNSKRGITTVLWNKIYRKELFNNIAFKEGAKYEDKLIMHHLLDRAKRIVYINYYGYHYWISADGITSSRNLTTAEWDYRAARDRFEFLIQKDKEDIKQSVTIDYLNQCIGFYKDCKSAKNKELLCEVKKEYHNVYKLLNKKYLNSIKEKIKFSLYWIVML